MSEAGQHQLLQDRARQALLFDTVWKENQQVWQANAIAFHAFSVEAKTLDELVEKLDEAVPEYLDRIAGHKVERPTWFKLLIMSKQGEAGS